MRVNKLIRHFKNPILLLSSIGISNIGAWIFLIGLNLIMLDMTSSAFAVTVLYILKPLATLFTNFWSGSLIDRLNKRSLMIGLDLFRGCLIFVLPSISTIWIMYVLVFFINMASSIFYQTSMIYMTKLIPSANRQRFNSLRSLISSGAFVLGPSIAGILFMLGTPIYAIYINSVSLFISSILIYYLPNIEKSTHIAMKHANYSINLILSDWKLVFQFSRDHFKTMLIVCLFYMVLVLTAAIDSIEASFSTEVLLLSNSKYGFLVSLAGVGFVLGSIINSIFSTKLPANILIVFGSIVLSIGYLIYAFSGGFEVAAIGFFILSFALAFANTGFDTFYQNQIPVEIMGRIGSIYGFFQAIFVILVTTIIGGLTRMVTLQQTVILASFFLLFTATVLMGVILLNSYSSQKDRSNKISLN